MAPKRLSLQSLKRTATKPVMKDGKKVGEVTTKHYNCGYFTVLFRLPEGWQDKIEDVPAQGSVPAHKRIRFRQVDIHLRDGLAPSDDGAVEGVVDVGLRVVRSTADSESRDYNYLNIRPLTDAERPKYELRVMKGAKEDPELPDGTLITNVDDNDSAVVLTPL